MSFKTINSLISLSSWVIASFWAWLVFSNSVLDNAFSISKTSDSALTIVSTSQTFFLSFSLFSSASLTSFSTSSFESSDVFWIVIVCSLLVLVSFAVTFVIPLTSIEKLTSIWGTPLGAGSMFSKLNSCVSWY